MDRNQVIEILAELRETADYLPTDQKYLDALEHAQNLLEEGGAEQGPRSADGSPVDVPGESAGLQDGVVAIEKKLLDTIYAQIKGVIDNMELHPKQCGYKCALYDTFEKLKLIYGVES